MSFTSPIADITFLAKLFGLDQLEAEGLAPELADGLAEAVLEEAGKFATDRIAPLNRVAIQLARVLTRAMSPPRPDGSKPIAIGPMADGMD